MADENQNPKDQNQQESKEEEEEEEPLQALRLKALAEQKYISGNLSSALKYAKRAHNLRPKLAGVSEMLTSFNILNTSRQAPLDYYKMLQIERFSHINTIKKQYKKLALILHPDKNPFTASEEAFKLVGEAFRVLSDKIRRKEYDMKLRISMQEEAAAEAVGLEEEGVEMFWTACSTCRLLHKFERKYLGQNLVCPSCKKSFKAVEVLENVKEGDEEEEDKGVGRMKGSAWIRERKGGKLGYSGRGLSEQKRKIDSVGEVLERPKGKLAKNVGGNEGKSEGLKSKEVGKDTSEGAGGDAEIGDVIEGLRLRSGRKVRVGDELMERTRAKRANVGEEEMMTLAEMQTIAKRKLSEEKMKVKGEEKEREEVKEKGKEKENEIEEGETEEEMAVVKVKEKRDTQGVSKNENLVVYKRRASKTLGIEKEKELEEVREKEKEKEWEESRQKEKENGIKEREKEKEMAMVKVREKRERRKTWKFESLGAGKRSEEKEKEKEMEDEREKEMEMGIVKVKEKTERQKTSKIESLKVMKRREEKDKEKEMEEEMEKKTETSMVKVKGKRDRRKTSKNESLEVIKRRGLKSGNMEIEKHKESGQTSLEIVAVGDSDFYDFDKDRVGRNFKKGQVWALYDDDDGMPRHYALIDKVFSVNPFEVRLNWLEFQSNGDDALISWEKSGFRISCGRFKVSTSIVVKSLKIFSHVADCERAARELYRIYPKKGSVWVIYNENALDAEQMNLTVKNKRCYDIVVLLTSYSEMHGLSMAYLEKVDGFRTVFQRREIGAHAIRWLEKEDYRLFSHQIRARKLSGEEASGLSKDCWELDPASIPTELLTIGCLPAQWQIEYSE